MKQIDSHSDRPARAMHPRSSSISGVAISMTPVSKYTAAPVGSWYDVPTLWDRTTELLAGERDHLRVDRSSSRPDGSEVWTDLELSLSDYEEENFQRRTYLRSGVIDLREEWMVSINYQSFLLAEPHGAIERALRKRDEFYFPSPLRRFLSEFSEHFILRLASDLRDFGGFLIEITRGLVELGGRWVHRFAHEFGRLLHRDLTWSETVLISRLVLSLCLNFGAHLVEPPTHITDEIVKGTATLAAMLQLLPHCIVNHNLLL